MKFDALLLDLDGVFYIDNNLIPGAKEILNVIKEKSINHKFITNTTTLCRKSLSKKLHNLGLNIKQDDIVSANYVGSKFIKNLQNSSFRLLLTDDAKKDYKNIILDNNKPDYIVIGDIGNKWDFNLMNEIFNQVMNGSKIIALHKGKYFMTNAGLQIDTGAFVKGIDYATGIVSESIGKPNKDFFSIAIDSFKGTNKKIAMVGDDLVNDIYGAQKNDIIGILVKTGKFTSSDLKRSDIIPDYIIDSIKDLKNFI